MTDEPISDNDFIASITPDVMRCLAAAKFFEALDDAFSPVDETTAAALCRGHYEESTRILQGLRFDDTEVSEILDVLASRGGCCDCEILYNVADTSRLKAKYWRARADGTARPRDHHEGNRA
jgi:Protein of unknown function (DUF2695)